MEVQLGPKKVQTPISKANNPANNQDGVALLIVIMFVGILAYIGLEMGSLTSTEYKSATYNIHSLKAKYAAKSGAEISLLRVLLYKKATTLIKNAQNQNPDTPIPITEQMLDVIWSFPFGWPPTQLLGEEAEDASAVTKSELNDLEEESVFDAQYLTTIESEGGRIDINGLASPSKKLRDSIFEQILTVFESQLESDEAFEDEYDDKNFRELVFAMMDWVDENKTKEETQASESLDYSDYNIESEMLPPNAAFKTIKEIRLVKGMDDTLFDLLKDRVTVFGIRGIQVNYADRPALQSIDEKITDEIANEIISRRNDQDRGGPFKDEDEFFSYASSLGLEKVDFNANNIPLLFDPVYNFRITSTGLFRDTKKEITIITYDADSLKNHYARLLDKEDEDQNPPDPNDPNQQPQQPDPNEPNGSNPSGTQAPAPPVIEPPTGRPSIVFWNEE